MVVVVPGSWDAKVDQSDWRRYFFATEVSESLGGSTPSSTALVPVVAALHVKSYLNGPYRLLCTSGRKVGTDTEPYFIKLGSIAGNTRPPKGESCEQRRAY